MSDEYTIGYRRPPKHSRFPSGRSGNPRGRPRGSRPLAVLIREELDQMVAVSEGGRPIRLRKRQIIAKTMVNNSAKGDPRAISQLIVLLQRAGGELVQEPDPGREELSAADAALLKRFRERNGG